MKKAKHSAIHNHKKPHYWLRGSIIGFLYYQIYLLISGIYFPHLYSSLHSAFPPIVYSIIVKLVQIYQLPIIPITYLFNIISNSRTLAFQILIFISIMIYCVIIGAIIGILYKKIRKK